MDLEKLNIHFGNLAILPETDNQVISCYINNETGRSGYRNVLDARISDIRKTMSSDQLLDFEGSLGKVEAFLAVDVHPEAKGVAVFARGGESPFFQALQFRLPLPNSISVDSVPHIYELVLLKDTYHRYVILLSTESQARIVEVCVGNITRMLWTERPELRKRAGRGWTKEQYQNHRKDRTQKFIKEKIEILDRIFAENGHSHLVLAGNPRIVARVRDKLPKHLVDRLVEIVNVPGNTATTDVVSVTLSAFADYEETESKETASLLLNELRTGGLAVAGTEATLKALAQGQVDNLVMSESYAAPNGWKCHNCKAIGVGIAPIGCPQCGERAVTPCDLKQEIIRSAEQRHSTVEIVRNSDILLEVGGIGCLLRYMTSEQHAAASRIDTAF